MFHTSQEMVNILNISLVENINVYIPLAESKHNAEINVIFSETYCEPNGSNIREKKTKHKRKKRCEFFIWPFNFQSEE